MVKNLPATHSGDLGSIPGLGRSPGEGNDNPLQYSCLENPRETDVMKQLLTATAAAKSLQLCPTLLPHRRQPTRLLCPWDAPGKNTGVGCLYANKN